ASGWHRLSGAGLVRRGGPLQLHSARARTEDPASVPTSPDRPYRRRRALGPCRAAERLPADRRPFSLRRRLTLRPARPDDRIARALPADRIFAKPSPPRPWSRARSSAGEHYVDIVGV